MKTIMPSRNFHVLAPLCLTLGGCIIDFPSEEETGSTGAEVETSGEPSTGNPSGETEDGDGSSGSTGESPMGSCGEQSVVASHSGEVGTEVWSAGIHEVDDIYVNGALTVEPCAVLRMAPAATLSVRDGGSLTITSDTTGVVDNVDLSSNEPMLLVNGQRIPTSQIKSVGTTTTTAS